MDFKGIVSVLDAFVRESPLNRMKDLGGLRLFENPLVGVAEAIDPLFARLKDADAIGPHHLGPAEWLPGAGAVVSWFLPFTAEVRAANRRGALPAIEWLYGRIEGQEFIAALSAHLVRILEAAGHRAVAPAIDPRFTVVARRSNWSERHAAFIAGLGTFGLSRSLITERGSAGRLGSVVVDLDIEPTPRPYDALDEYCTHCGGCIHRCPPVAITDAGKDHGPCAEWLDLMKIRYAPRYGCGKCQTGVSCEARIPAL